MRMVFMHPVYLCWVDENGLHALGIFALSWWEWSSCTRYNSISLMRMVFMHSVYLCWVDENGLDALDIFALSWWEWSSCTRYICIELMRMVFIHSVYLCWVDENSLHRLFGIFGIYSVYLHWVDENGCHGLGIFTLSSWSYFKILFPRFSTFPEVSDGSHVFVVYIWRRNRTWSGSVDECEQACFSI